MKVFKTCKKNSFRNRSESDKTVLRGTTKFESEDWRTLACADTNDLKINESHILDGNWLTVAKGEV